MNIIDRKNMLFNMLNKYYVYNMFIHNFTVKQQRKKIIHQPYYKSFTHLIMECNNYGQNEIDFAFDWDEDEKNYFLWKNISDLWNKILIKYD